MLPTLLWRTMGIDPLTIAYAEVFFTDLLLGVAVYTLSQLLFRDQFISLLAAFLALGARVSNWNLATYGYIGNWYPYPGDLVLPFAIFVLVLLLKHRTRWALVLTGALALIHPAQAVNGAAVIVLYLLFTRREHQWRSIVRWGLLGSALFVAGLLPSAWVSFILPGEGRVSTSEWLGLVRLNQHFVPWLSWYHWAFFIPFAKWVLLWTLSLGNLVRLDHHSQRVLYSVWAATLLLCVAAPLFIALGIPTLIQLGLFRVTVLFNVVAVPLVAAQFFIMMKTRSLLLRLLALAFPLSMALSSQPPSWLLLATMTLAELSIGRLALWSVSISTTWRRRFGWASWVLLAAFVATIGLDYRSPSMDFLVRVHAFVDLLLEQPFAGRPASIFLLLMGLGVAAYWISDRFRLVRSSWVVLAIVVVGLAVPFLNDARYVGDEQRSDRFRDWKATQDWARLNTPAAATFIGFPIGDYPQEWRTYSLRNLVDLIFRGYFVYFSDQTLMKYDERAVSLFGLDLKSVPSRLELGIETTQLYEGFTDADFSRIAQQTGATYALIQKPRTLGFSVAYENPHFAVYDLTKPTRRQVEFSVQVPNGNFEAVAEDGLVPGWSAENARLSTSSSPYQGNQALKVTFDQPGKIGWLVSGQGSISSPPSEAAYQTVPGSLYRIRSWMRGQRAANVDMFAIEYDHSGKSTTTYLGHQFALDQRYVVNPHYYVPQVVFFKPLPTTESFRFAVRFLYDQPNTGAPVELEVDQVQMSRFEGTPYR